MMTRTQGLISTPNLSWMKEFNQDAKSSSARSDTSDKTLGVSEAMSLHSKEAPVQSSNMAQSMLLPMLFSFDLESFDYEPIQQLDRAQQQEALDLKMAQYEEETHLDWQSIFGGISDGQFDLMQMLEMFNAKIMATWAQEQPYTHEQITLEMHAANLEYDPAFDLAPLGLYHSQEHSDALHHYDEAGNEHLI